MKKYLIVLSALFAACSTPSIPKATVAITNMASTSGGSGTIIDSTSKYSRILTNAHVCGVLKNGGLIHSYKGESIARGYVLSQMHDLCMVYVVENLGVHTKVAEEEAAPYTPSMVSGHPHLLPTILTEGYFSSHMHITVMIGTRACTEKERNADGTGLICALLGEIPITETYESTLVSNLIQPGSSGSAVYDANGEISSVIFAGDADLSWGFSVPHGYVKLFVNTESKLLPVTLIPYKDQTAEESSASSTSPKEYKEKLSAVCAKATTVAEKKTCSMFGAQVRYNDMVERE